MKLYRGGFGFSVVVLDGVKRYFLKPHNKFTPAFCWGRSGLCASELAYAILCDCCGKRIASKYYPAFKWDVIINLSHNLWQLTEEKIKQYIKQYSRKRGVANE